MVITRMLLLLQLERIQIPVSSLLVSFNVHCLVTTIPTCWQRNPRVRSARPGYIQHYMLSTLYVDKDRGVPGDGQHYMFSTLYVERRVPGDGQRDYILTHYSQHYMLTLYSQHYMLTLFLEK